MPYRARSPETLLTSLQRMFEGRSKRELKRLLRDRRVTVNGLPTSDPEATIAEGDLIDVLRGGRIVPLHPLVRLVHEDDHLLVIDKGPGILTSGGVKGRALTAVDVVRAYLRKRGRPGGVHACHRLDRDVSGLLLLARRRDIAERVRAEPGRHLARRAYHALVEGKPSSPEGTIRSWLRDEEDGVVRPAKSPGEGKLCVTRYRVLETGKTYSTVEVMLETGRKNQIRAHMLQIGHPVAGDVKYGARTDPVRRVALHATRLGVLHPVTGEVLELTSPPPAEFAHADVRPRRAR